MNLNGSKSYQSQLDTVMHATGATGASFAYWDGTELHMAASGKRNSVTGDPVTTDTVMHIGSITKVMNAVLFMQLVDEGKLRLDDPVTKYLPSLKLGDAEALREISCAMLINHTSGINGDWLPEYGPDRERIVDAVDRCVNLEQIHPPGKAASYCNIATVIAGHLVQELRQSSWYTLIKDRIFEPLDMRHSLADPLELPRFRCSIGDISDFATGQLSQTQRPFLAPSFAPAGSTVMTTATDLVTFARALVSQGVGPNGTRILSADSTARMARRTASFAVPAWDVGLGWMIMPSGVLSHSGGGRGVQSQLFAHPKSGRAVVLLANCEVGGVHPAMINPILDEWNTGDKSVSPKVDVKGAIDMSAYIGVYENNLMRIEVFADGKDLAVRRSSNMTELHDINQSLVGRLTPIGKDRFEAKFNAPGVPNAEYGFVQPDAHGRMAYIASGFRLRPRIQ